MNKMIFLLFWILFLPVSAREASVTNITLANLVTDSSYCYNFKPANYILSDDKSLNVFFPNLDSAGTSCNFSYSRYDLDGTLLNSFDAVNYFGEFTQIGSNDFMVLVHLNSTCDANENIENYSNYCDEDFADSQESYAPLLINGDSISFVPEEPATALISTVASEEVYGYNLYDLVFSDNAQYMVFREPRSRSNKKRQWKLAELNSDGIDIVDLDFKFEFSFPNLSVDSNFIFVSWVNKKTKLYDQTNINQNGDLLLASKFNLYSYNLENQTMTKIHQFTKKKKRFYGIANIEDFGTNRVISFIESTGSFGETDGFQYYIENGSNLIELDLRPIHIFDKNNYIACKTKIATQLEELVLLTRASSDVSFSSIDVFSNDSQFGCDFSSEVISKSGDEVVLIQRLTDLTTVFELNDDFSYDISIYSENR